MFQCVVQKIQNKLTRNNQAREKKKRTPYPRRKKKKALTKKPAKIDPSTGMEIENQAKSDEDKPTQHQW